MNVRHLRVVRQVADTGSVTMAAAMENLSQPAVTQAIAKLERELGVTLFERRREGFLPTDIGAMFLARVERALDLLKKGAREAAQLGKRNTGRGFADFDRLISASQLTALVAMSKAHNFTIAARNIEISQPSVHRAARNLEALSGMQFFSTEKAKVILTPAAEAMARRAMLALSEIRQAREEISLHLGKESSRIAVGAMPLSRSRILPAAIDRMIRTAPGVQVRSVDGPYSELLTGLRNGELDCTIGALRDPLPAEDVVQEKLFDDPLAVVVGASHPLATAINPTLEQLLNFPWVAPPKDTPAGSYLFGALNIGNLPETPVRVVSSSLILVRGLLTAGDYVTIISPHQIAEERRQGLLVTLPIELKNSERPIGLTFRKDWKPTATQEKFVDLIRQCSREVIENDC